MANSASFIQDGAEKIDESNKVAAAYPEPLVIPSKARHTHTFVLLHGRGSKAHEFGIDFIASRTSSGKMLPQLFPGMKFIFPTAKKRRAAAYNRAVINQWFDHYPVEDLEDLSEHQDIQIEGLRESGAFVRQIILEEAKAVTLENVLVGGLSQGCAMALHVLLSFESDVVEDGALGGFVGMSGWLPFRDSLEEIIHPTRNHSEADDPSERGKDKVHDNQSVGTCVMDFVRDIMDLPPTTTDLPACLQTPVFLGHGELDAKVPAKLGRQAASTLEAMGMDVTWRGYEKLGHWYKVPEELDDIANFLQYKVGINRVN